MLIPSPRHTPQDRECWNELEAADRVQFPRLGDKVARAIESIREFVFGGEPYYVSTSWGKDSVVVLDLAFRAIDSPPAYHISQPDSDLIKENIAVQNAFWRGNAVGTIAIRATRRDWKEGQQTPELREGVRQIQGEIGGKRWIGGLRRKERGGRQFRTGAIMGDSCQPICDWTTEDVFAYLAGRGLPVHCRYAMTGGGRWLRDRIRVCTFGGYRGAAGGRREWEMLYYGDVLRRIEAANSPVWEFDKQ